jgi:hypothetical protein
MLCQETGSQEVVRIEGMSVSEAQDIGKALKAVRGHGRGDGEICIPLFSGVFDKIKIALTIYKDKQKKQ